MADDLPPTPPAPPAPPAPPPAPAWHEGVDAGLIGVAQNKAWDLTDPKKAFSSAVSAYRDAQKLIGVPENELVRLPKPNAPETDVKAFLGRIGVPAEAKEYDLSTVKTAAGTEIDRTLADTMRTALLEARVPKDRAAGVVAAVVKLREAEDTAAKAALTTNITAEAQALKTNWGNNYDFNLTVANTALQKLGAAAGLAPDKIKTSWDALAKLDGVGAATVMEMLRVVGARMGEAPFIAGGQGVAGQPLSQAAAKAEIDALKADKQFGDRLLAGGREERRKWDNLHQIAFPRQVA